MLPRLKGGGYGSYAGIRRRTREALPTLSALDRSDMNLSMSDSIKELLEQMPEGLTDEDRKRSDDLGRQVIL
jgi:hypothetical protein